MQSKSHEYKGTEENHASENNISHSYALAYCHYHAGAFVVGTPCVGARGSSASVDPIAELLQSPKVMIDTVWTLITAMLVFFMNLGFATVESGLCRAKSCVNILAKNFIVFGVSSLAVLIIGWGLMFGDGNSFMGLQGLFFLHGADNSPATGDVYQGVYSAINWTSVPLWTKFFFQLVFAGGGLVALGTQLIGVAAVGAYTFGIGIVAWGIIKAIMGIGVTAEEELEGLDMGEHGNTAYPDVQPVTIGGLFACVSPAGGQRTMQSAVPAMSLRTEEA